MLHETSQTQKDKPRMISLIHGSKKGKLKRNRVEWWLPGTGGVAEVLVKGHKLPVIR